MYGIQVVHQSGTIKWATDHDGRPLAFHFYYEAERRAARLKEDEPDRKIDYRAAVLP